MAAPSADELAALLGRPVDQEQADAAISVVSAMAKAYTRGVGWTVSGPNNEIAAVIRTASLRLMANPSGLLYDEQVGPESISYRSAFQGFTVGERMVLDRFRVKAM